MRVYHDKRCLLGWRRMHCEMAPRISMSAALEAPVAFIQVLRCEMARKNMYIRDDAAAAAKRGRIGDVSPYAGYPPAPAPAPAPAGAYYAPAPAVSSCLSEPLCSRLLNITPWRDIN